MASHGKITKIVLQSPDETETDITDSVVDLYLDDKYDQMCQRCGRAIPKRKHFERLRRFLFLRLHKCVPLRSFVYGITDVKVEFTPLEWREDE